METVAVIGPVPTMGIEYLCQGLGKDYQIVEIKTEDEYGKLADADFAILRILTLNAEAISKAPKLRLIQRWGAGFDSVDVVKAGKMGIPVAVAPGMNAGAVSEYTVLLMMATLRNLISIDRRTREGRWKDNTVIDRSFMLNRKLTGLIGMGSIGSQVAKKVQAFGAKVCYYDVSRLPEEMEQELHVTYMTLEELFESADIISCHIPLTDSTKHMIDRNYFNRMKPEAIIVNTSRGEIINEQDLYEALKTKQILGAALDVFEEEPARGDNPLMKLDNVVVSAHCGGNTIDISNDVAQCCIDNIKKIKAGECLEKPYLVNGEYLK